MPENLVEGDWWKRGYEPMPKSAAFIIGFAEAERQFYASDSPDWINPFAEGSDEWEGFEEGVYTFTQK